jgi:hypothetical protein
MNGKLNTLKDFKNLKCGDQIIVLDPLLKTTTTYALLEKSNYEIYYFISTNGTSLIVDCQETIDYYKLEIINKKHPKWNPTLTEQIHYTLEYFKKMDI